MRATSVPREVERPYCRLQLIGDALGDPKADLALALIRSCPDGATRSELGQRLFGKHRRVGLDRVLDLLRSSGFAEPRTSAFIHATQSASGHSSIFRQRRLGSWKGNIIAALSW